MYKRNVLINTKYGIHLRIAAEIVQKSEKLNKEYNVNLYIKKSEENDSINISILGVLSLKIKQGEIVEISCREDSSNGKNAVEEMCDFINNIINESSFAMNTIDDIIEQTTIANEQIIDNIPIGIVVVDINSSIIMINSYSRKLLGKTEKDLVGKKIKSIIPTSVLPEILISRQKISGDIEKIGDKVVIVNGSPIISGDNIIGAVETLQDISELVVMKELNEKFKKVLEASGDLICFIDENRKITYLNPAYIKQLPESSMNALGKDLVDVSPDGLRMKVFNSKTKIENVIYKKESIDMVSTVEPLFIDGKFKGVISVSRPANQIKNLIKKLEESEEKIKYYREELARQTRINGSFKDIIGSSGSLRNCLLIAEKASHSTSNVLIRGESGTGKELIAKAIHNNSDRKNMPFIRVNCAAIPENLLESELFGYEKGAFTGAIKNKQGKFAIADKGTIFLDEIGDLPKTMQVKLLRVIQEKEFESIGSLNTQKVDVRVLAATNRNLEEMVKSGEFREDLYYRLNVIGIVLPPLRYRKEDINLLVEHFIKKISKKLNKKIDGIDKESIIYLCEYNWPGNIRELENVIERAINMCDGRIITKGDLPLYVTNLKSGSSGLINFVNGELLPYNEYEKELISAAMKKYKSYNKAGKVLGITHRTVALKCKKYGIEQE